MSILTLMDEGREASASFLVARDRMVAVYDSHGVESTEFDQAYAEYVAALEDYQNLMDELDYIREQIMAM